MVAGSERDTIYAALQARNDHFTETQDETPLLEPQAQSEAERLHYLAISFVGDHVEVDLYALHVLAWYRWFRYACLPAGEDAADFDEAARLFGILRGHNPSVGPPQLEEILSRPAPLSWEEKAAFTYHEAEDWLEKFRHTGDRKLLDRAINEFGRASWLASDPEWRTMLLGEWARVLRLAYESFDDLPSLDRAIEVNRTVLDGLVDGSPDRAAAVANLGNALQIRFERRGAADDIEEAVELCRRAVALTSRETDPSHVAALANALRRRSVLTSSDEDLEEALRLGLEAATGTPAEAPEAAKRWANVAATHNLRYGRTGNRPDLDEAVEVSRRAVALTSPDHPDRYHVLNNLGAVLLAVHGEDGGSERLDLAVEALTEAATSAGSRPTGRAQSLSSLGLALQLRASQNGDRADLDEAIRRLRESVGLTDESNTSFPARAVTLGNTLLSRAQDYGTVSDLDEAVAMHRAALTLTPAGHPDRPGRHTALSTGLREMATWRRSAGALDEALDLAHEAVADASDAADRAIALADLGNVLLQKFEMTEDVTCLDGAVRNGRAAVALCPPGHRYHPLLVSQLVGQLKNRFDRFGDRSDLDEAVQFGRQALAANSTALDVVGNLGVVLQLRYSRYGSADDLIDATDLARRAMDLAPKAGQWRGSSLVNLASTMYRIYDYTSDPANLDDVIGLYRDATAMFAGHPMEGPALVMLAWSLLDRFNRTADGSDLSEAVEAAESAATLESSQRAFALSTLSVMLRRRHDVVEQPAAADLDRAVSAGREAVELTAVDHPDRARRLGELGRALRDRFLSRRRQADLTEFDVVLREAMSSRTAEAEARLSAAVTHGTLFHDIDQAGPAPDSFALALRLLPLVAWHGLDRSAREDRLTGWAHLGTDAAATAIAAGEPVRAVEFLEQGRSVLWEQWLQRRSDLTEVVRVDPGLAGRLTAVRDALDTADAVASPGFISVRRHLLSSGAVRTGGVDPAAEVA
jgi:tetratricopeptide (TPR) repeat protein